MFRATGLTVLNAHYTDPVLVTAIYRALGELGLERGTVAEAGVGSGQFAMFAPEGIGVTGIELDPATALIAQLLSPHAEILIGSVSDQRFARVRDQSANPVRVPRDAADGFVGNVPFSRVKWPDDVLNPGTRFPLHDHAIMWGVTRVAPGGLCAFITSRYTADKQNPGFRRALAEEFDLIGMVRLPSTAHKRMAGTSVVTDIIIGRRLGGGERPRTLPETWEQSRLLPIPGSSVAPLVNRYFHDNPRHVLGRLKAGGMRRADDFEVVPTGDLAQQLSAALKEITERARAAGQRHEPRRAARPVIEVLSRRPDGTVTAHPNGTFTVVVHGQDKQLVIKDTREADQVRRLDALANARAEVISLESSCPEDTDETDAARARMGEIYDSYAAAYGPIGSYTVRTQPYHNKSLKAVLDRLDFSRNDVLDPEVKLLEAYLGRGALTRIVKSVTDPGHVRTGTRKDKQGKPAEITTQLVETARVRAALTDALDRLPEGADAERLRAVFGERISRIMTGEHRTRLMPPAFRADPRRPAVEALEDFDLVTQTATKRPAFFRRTAAPHRMELGADTPQEALDLVLIHHRRVDLGEIARLLGTGKADARKQLGTLVFDDPATGRLVAAGEYLSGNVLEKLATAREAAARDPGRYAVNAESLQAVQPDPLPAEDIQARLGSAWLSHEIVQEGLRHLLKDPRLTVTHPGGSQWTVASPGAAQGGEYGTSDWPAAALARALLTNASITVYRTRIDPKTEEETKYRDDVATLFAFQKAQRLDADFVSWLWSDPQRAEECARLYNNAYNNHVKRTWDSSPFHVPGLAPGIRLHPFQNSMVRRLHTESGLGAWVVGAGKTELGIAAAMEGYRLGRHQLTAIVTPASLVNQWRDRVYRTYPGAKVLVADDDLRDSKDARAVFIERAASGDYQLALTPYEFFGSFPLSAGAARASADEEIAKLTRYARQAAAQGDRYTAKAYQEQVAKIEAQYKAAARATGAGATLVDFISGIVVDEVHKFRRFRRESENRSLAIVPGSARANHMLSVFDYLRTRHPDGLRLGLTGTPLEQSIADAWAMMRLFVPEILAKLGLEEFDAFLTTFGRTEPRREPTPTGGGVHLRERQADWFNLTDMRRTLWDPFADVVRRADLGLKLPKMIGGRPQLHVLPMTPGQAERQAGLDGAYELFKFGNRDPENHILRLMDQGAKNALHPRMLGMETDGEIKLEAWADDAAAWYHASKDAGYLDREGNPHPVPGALRVVACEIGVPDSARPNAWSVYSEMRSLLADRGVPAETVRFAQDSAGSDRKKAALWEDARTGRCNFVIGSAQTAGTGVDIPDRLQVLDYMTLSWNPTEFEQWLGRIIRQGNQNAEVAVHVWATEGTIEAVRADKIAMKAAPFEALLDGTSQTRRLTEEDDNPVSMFATEMTARMTGNPLLNAQREAQLEADVAQGLQNEWQRENIIKGRRATDMEKEIGELEAQNAAIDAALSRAADTRGDKFAARVGTTRHTVRAEAGTALIAALAATAAEDDISMLSGGNPLHLGELAGFDVTARYHRATFTLPAQAGEGLDDGGEPETVERTLITLGLEGVPHGQVPVIDAGDLPGRDPAALVTSLEDRIRRLPGRKEDNTAAITAKREQVAETRDALARPSPYLKQLADARDALDRINEQINELLKDAVPETDAVAPAGAEDAESAPAPPGERTQDAAPAPEPVAGVAAPPAGDAEDLPPWTASSPYSGAIGTALRAALADSDVTQVAGSNRLGGFLEWLSDSGWMSDHAAAAVGDDGQVPPFARAVFDDPVFAADVACAVGTAVHARCAGQPLPPESAARRPIPPMTEMPALRYWQEQDVAIGRAAGTDTWYDLVDAARIDIWLSRAGLPRAGRQVVIGSGGHAALELTAAGGEQWRLTVPARKDTQHEATARYKVTRSGNDAWEALLNGTPGSTTPEQAAALLIGTLTEQGALPPPADAPAPGQASNTPLPPATPAPHSSPQPATAPAPTQPATSTPGGDNDASAPQPDSGPLRDLAAAHGMHYHYDSGTEIAAVFRSETRAGQPVLRQGHPGGPLMNETGRVIPGEHAGAYLAEAARVPHLNSDSLYQQVIPGAVAGEESSPRSAAHAMFSVSAIQARDTGVPQVVYADGHAAVAGPEPPPGGGAYYLATPRGPDVAWTRHMDGTAEPVSHHLQARDLSVIAGETAGHPAPQPPAPEEDSLPQPPTSGLTREELDFARQHAYEFAIGTIRDPDQAQEERALDYAAWYMAEFGDAESLADLPGHDHAWGWFIDRGYPARKPAAPAGGQHDGTQPGTGATAGAAGPPGHADPQPPEPRRQHPDEARPDRAASSAAVPPAEQLDAMTAAALADRAIAGTARQGDTQNFEIAFTDWARHWLAATAVQAIDAARPGPAPPWAVALLDNEELIADMTAAAAGRVLRLAAAGHGAGESPGQPQDDRTPAPDQERDDAAASTSQAGAPAPAVARDLIPPVTVLHGHVSEETAVEVPDYPYGSLRCTMRYWLETRKGHGVRLVHQTTNPKKPGQPRNKPHKDTYSSWAVLYQAANGHVERHACEFWGPSPAADARIRIDGTYDQLDDAERAAYDKHLARALNANTRGWEDWHAQLASIRGHLAEHGTLPDPGQLAKARGGLRWLHEAEAVAAVAAVAAGLGGIHAAPPTADPPGTSAPSPEPAVPAATQSGPGTDAGPAADKTAQSSGPDSPSGAEEPEPGMTPDELDLVYQAAINWVLSGIASPTRDQQERALDYAAWYMTEIRDGDSIDDLLDHQHAWNWFVDRGYPARAASGQGDREQPRAEAAAGPTGHADPEPPAGPWSAARLRQLAEAHGLAAATDRTGGTLTVTVHDQGRTVLLHDDLNGTVAGGRRLNPGQVAAYVAAYASHPQLPPRCLLDLARNDPAEPASLTLTAARETAARHGLEVRVRRSGGRSYVNFCEPSAFHGFGGSRYTPVLSYPAGAGSAYHGPCAVPVAAIDSYLGAYRASVPTATFAALEPMDCGYRAVPLTPHLIDGSGLFIPAVRDRWRAALTAARDRNAAEVFRLLEEAEGLTPVSLTPEREAELTAGIRRHAARYRTAEDPAARLATDERRNLDITWREQGWVRDYIAAHPEVLDHAEEDEPAATPDSDRDAAASLAAQAREALASGEHERALALIDETELLLPGIAATAGYDQARDHVRAAMRQASPAPGQHAAATTTQEPADQATGAEEPETAHIPGARDANGAGTTTPASDPAAAEVPPAAPVTGTGTEENAEAPAAAHLEPDTGDSNAEHQQPGSTAAQEKASPTEGQEATAAGHWQPGGAAAPAVPGMTISPPEGTRPLGLHRAWGGNPRPERLLYADGTPLSVRRQGEDGGQVLTATAAGVVDAQADIDDGPDLQVVRFDDGQYGVVHPALAGFADIDPYGGLSERDRARWQAFDYGESLAAATAGLLPHLVDAGDKFYVQSGQRSQTVSLREVQSAGRGTGPDAGYYKFKIDNGTTLSYPPGDRVAVRIPDNHPTLETAISATLAAGLGRPETAPPPEDRAAADSPATVTSAPDSPGHASGLDEHGETGPYSGRVRIALESGRPAVSGTEFDDPPELRKVLRDNFTWDKKRQVWEYNAKKAAGPEEAAQAVRDALARLDRESAPAQTVREFPPTPQQQAILDAFLAGLGIAVQALAGTGKTTTLVLLARALMERSPQARIVYTAFNASIVKDAKRGRFGRNVTASTMHSLARQALLQTGYAGKIEHADQGARWPEQWAEVLGIPEGAAAGTRDGAAPADAAEIARLVIATVRKFRESADGEPGRQHLPYLAGPAGSPLSETVLSYARQAWADISDTGNARALAAGRALRVEHDDYLKVWALSQPVINAEVIFFDEAQDVNDVMRAVVLAQTAQTVVVGDSHQSIYGFRGAIDALKDWPADIVLPLTQSWRFGPAAAEFGNLFLRSLGSKLLLEGNPARDTRLGSAPEPDAILCRTNATAVAEVFAGLESGKRTALAGGGDAIKEIAKAARDLQAGRGTKHPDLSRFADWGEVRDYARNDEDGKSLQVFVRLVDQHGPGGLIAMIDQLTPEGDNPQLTISTAHKAKGLEWDVVRVAGDFRGPATDPETGEVTWPVPEERRLAYVAATRARKLLEPGSLTWIYDYPLPGNRAARGPASGQDHQAQADTPGQPEDAGREREPAPQAAPATTEDSPADDAPAQQPAPAPATAQAPASDAAASGQVPGASGPDAGQQEPAGGKDTAPAAPGQDSAGAGPGNAHPDRQPSAAEADPGEDRAAPAAEPDRDRSLAAGQPAGTRAAGTDDGADPGEQPAAARSDPGTLPAASLEAAGTPPEADAHAVLRALAEQHGMAVTAEQVSPTITVTTVTDGGRFVLRHDDFLGAAADGTRIDLDEAEAYLAAWRAYPGLPALALLDWVRRGADGPAQLSLSAARAVAADCGLVAEPVRAAGQPFIIVRHPGLSGTVLACPPGDPAASAGPVTVPVPSVGTYLRLYQAAVKPHWVTALGKRGEWASQLTAMMPYLINGTSLYSEQAHQHVDAAAHAAGMDDDRAVKDLLRRAWAAAGPFSPSLDRKAVLLRVIGDVAPRYQEITGDGPRYAAETAHASDPEWGWIYQHVRDHPDILTAPTPTRDALEQREAGERAQAEAEGSALSAAAKAAFDAGDYPAALDLADQGETADPGRARRWEQIRGAIREKAAAAGQAPETAIPERSAPTAPEAGEPPTQQAAALTAEPAAAGGSASADAGPGADDGARPGELSPLAVPAGHDESVRFLEELAARYGLRVSHVTDTLKWWTVHLSALDGGAGVPVAEYEGHTGKWSGFGAGRLDPGEVAAYLAARGEGDLHDAPAGPSDPYTRIGQARYDYHKALLAYQALRETKAGRSLMEIHDTDKPRPDAIALNAAYQAVSGGWKKAFVGEAEEVTGRFAAWEQTARVMARNLAATRHRAGIFRAALDVFTESAGHLASRTRATAEDPAAWARVSEGLPRSTQAGGPTAGEKTTATGDTPQTAVPGPASQPETPRPSSAQDTSGAAQPPPASPQQPASDSPGAQAREAASPAPAPDLTNADPGAAPQAMPPGDAAPQSADPGEDTSAQAEETRTLTLADLTGPSPDWMSASLCEGCGKLHGDDCPAPVTAPPPGLHGDDDELTPLGAVVEDAARYLAMRGYLDPDADGGVPDWVLAELAEIAHEKPCGGPGCAATADGFLSPSPAADHFLQRRRQEWERWLPRWSCTCGRTFKVCPEPPGTAFYAITPDGMLGDLAGHVTPDAKRRTVKDSGACCPALKMPT